MILAILTFVFAVCFTALFCVLDEDTLIELISCIGMIFSCITFIALIITALFTQNFYKTEETKLREQYNTYISIIESKDYDNLVILSSDIAEYNAKVLNGKRCRENPWINWYTYPFYDKFETIDINEILNK